MKTKVVTIAADSRSGDYKAGEHGYIDGYVQGADERPYAVVVFEDSRLVLASIHHLKIEEKPYTP